VVPECDEQIHYNVHRDIDVDEYRVEAEHMAEVVKEMGRAVNTGLFYSLC